MLNIGDSDSIRVVFVISIIRITILTKRPYRTCFVYFCYVWRTYNNGEYIIITARLSNTNLRNFSCRYLRFVLVIIFIWQSSYFILWIRTSTYYMYTYTYKSYKTQFQCRKIEKKKFLNVTTCIILLCKFEDELSQRFATVR